MPAGVKVYDPSAATTDIQAVAYNFMNAVKLYNETEVNALENSLTQPTQKEKSSVNQSTFRFRRHGEGVQAVSQKRHMMFSKGKSNRSMLLTSLSWTTRGRRINEIGNRKAESGNNELYLCFLGL